MKKFILAVLLFLVPRICWADGVMGWQGAALDDLNDVSISSVANNDTIVYSSVLQEWVNVPMTAIVGSNYTSTNATSDTGWVNASGGVVLYNLNSNVGIGVTNPAARLSIRGAGTGTGIILRLSDSAAVNRLVVQDNGNVGIGTTAPIGLLTVGTLPSPGLVVLADGNVGVGSTNPGARLVVKAAGTSSGVALQVADSSGNNRFVVLDNGNVGVGTATPNTKFVVGSIINPVLNGGFLGSAYFSGQGNSSTNAGLFVVHATNTSNADRPIFGAVRARGSISTPLSVVAGNDMFSFLTAAYDGTGLVYPAQILYRVDDTVSTGVTPTAVDIQTGTNSTTRVARLTVRSTGNIGIGTTAPTQKLDVVGTANVSVGVNVAGNAVLTTASQLAGAVTGTSGNTAIATGAVGAGELASTAVTAGVYGSATVVPVVTVDADGRITNVTNATITVTGSSQWVDGTDDAIGYTAGNVGIGTTAPTDNLYVQGNVTINGALTVLNATNWTHNGLFGIGNTAPGNYQLSIQDNGNVGIGTTTPNAALQVAGAVNATAMNIGANYVLNSTSIIPGSSIAAATLAIQNKTYGLDALNVDGSYLSIVIIPYVPKALTVTRLTGKATGGGTSVTGMLAECTENQTGCVNLNATSVFTNNATALSLTSFTDNTITAGSSVIFNLTVSGTVPQFNLGFVANE